MSNVISRLYRTIKSVGLWYFLAGDTYCGKCRSGMDKKRINLSSKVYEKGNKIKNDYTYKIICSRCEQYLFKDFNGEEIFKRTKTLRSKIQ